MDFEENKNNEEKKDLGKWFTAKRMNNFPYPVLATIIFLLMGFVWGLWHPGWIVFLTIPLFYWIVNAIRFRTVSYTLIVAIIYVAMGLIWGIWHPGWIIFLAIPIIHWFVGR